MNRQELITFIESYAPVEAAAPWDNSGVQVESDKNTVDKLCVALDPTPGTISAALELKADFLLCHHPLSLSPRYLNTRDQYFHIVRKLLHADCLLYAAHTSLDANPRGPASWLAQSLRLQDCEILDPLPAPQPETREHKFILEDSGFSAPSGYGFGLIGNLPQALPFEIFASRLNELLLPESPPQSWRLCGQPHKEIKKIACCPGSGASLAEKAAIAGADIYITGDMKYHDALGAPVCILDVGHFCLEERMMLHFTQLLGKADKNMEVRFLPADNPFRQVAI